MMWSIEFYAIIKLNYFSGLTRKNFPSVLACLATLIRYKIDLKLTDVNGDSALHVLMRRQRHPHLDSASVATSDTSDTSDTMTDEKLILLEMLLMNGCDVNHVNLKGRSVLSLSLDNPVITRYLLNSGARVWPTEERNHSAFTWFLRNVIKKCSLDGYEHVLDLISRAMKVEVHDDNGNHQRIMRNHVTSTMMYLGRNYDVIGPIFKQVLARVSPYWNRPPSLKQICFVKIRRTLGPKKIAQGAVGSLRLPKKIQNYLLYN